MTRDAQGGEIWHKDQPNNVAGIEYVEYQNFGSGNDVKVMLSTMPRTANYVKDDQLTINAKSTINNNSQWAVKVIRVDGPMNYLCRFV